MNNEPGTGPLRERGPHRHVRGPTRARRWKAGVAGAAAIGLTAGVAYVATGSSGEPASSRPVADRAAAAPSPMPSPAAAGAGAGEGPSRSASGTAARAKAPVAVRKTAAAGGKRPPKRKVVRRTTAPKKKNATLAEQVVALANAERAKNGCAALTSQAGLQAAAQGHSDDMVARNFFSHTNPSGREPGARITAAGYRWSTYGENIAYGQKTPAEVMTAWMNSSGHRANILNCRFKEIGVGVAFKSGTPYWTQDFGARR
ncbi:CAP domain-containing protein [Actinomadura roseirufa]|uniref:CAP domain-containing protein n=1 Tax=Actinomadura roseirufa TaxID=2094049 RepID=UPI0010413A44|nr:CAP domain-containing protein [Actinomadura roseirufa]